MEILRGIRPGQSCTSIETKGGHLAKEGGTTLGLKCFAFEFRIISIALDVAVQDLVIYFLVRQTRRQGVWQTVTLSSSECR